MWLFNLLFFSLSQLWYVEVRISRNVSVSPLEFEITRVDCISDAAKAFMIRFEQAHLTVRIFIFFFFIWFLRPFQEYFTYIEPIVLQRWAKTGEPGENHLNIRMQNLAFSHVTRNCLVMCTGWLQIHCRSKKLLFAHQSIYWDTY